MSAGESEICTVGIGNGLNYRGYNIEDLALNSKFEETFFLLLYGRLPLASELAVFIRKISSKRHIP